MHKSKVKIYPPKTPSVVPTTSIFPITNFFNGNVLQTALDTNYSFIYPTFFSLVKNNCALWYCPVAGLTLQNVTFQYEVISDIGDSQLAIYVNGSQIAIESIPNTVGNNFVTFDDINYNLKFGDSVFIKFIITSGSYKAFASTAIFEFQ
jgi:hypothetical protein